MQAKNIPTLIAALNEGVVAVTITKKDGTSRVMAATRCLEHIPESQCDKLTDPNASGTLVWDTENEGWRNLLWSAVQ